ncbi:MAG: ankyrin repeat domain-containing protein [Planctomycetota bacterium]|nr:ankyrin repeat domain-containing protein [Planctomycetota bacterium]
MRTTSILSLTLASFLTIGAVAQDANLSVKNPGRPQQQKPDSPKKGDPNAKPSQAPGIRDIPVSDKANAKELLGSQSPVAPVVPLTPAPVVFEPGVLNLGEMQAEVPKTGKIGLRNTSDKEVKITKAIPGCGCTTAGAPKDPIPPGGIAEVEITLKPGPKQGLHLSKKITFQVEGFAPVVLTVEGDVTAYVTLAPDIIQSPTAGQTLNTEIKLASADGTPFKVTGCIPDVLQAAPEDSSTEHVLVIDWDKWEQNGRAVKLSIRTDHPKAEALTVMVKRAIDPTAREPKAPPQSPRRDSQPMSSLVSAARGGDLARVQLEVANGADVNAVDSASGRSALHWAANEGKTEVVVFLIEKGASTEAMERVGKTPLALAAERKHVDATRALLSAKADVNHRDRLGGTPLTWAAGLGSAETVGLLLGAGAEVNVIDSNGMTPLLWAAGIGNPESVRLLVQKGADLKQADAISGDTALTRAARNGGPEAVLILIEAGSDVNAINREGMTALLLAAQAGNLEKVQALVKHGADANAKTRSGMDAKAVAAGRGDDKGRAVAEWLATQNN